MEGETEAQATADEARAHVEGLRSFYGQRRSWSWFLIGCIGATILFQIALAFSIGFGWLNFERYQWFLPAVVIENFAQIVGMGYVVVNFLFATPGRPAVRPPRR